MTAPYKGIRILDLTRVLAGPYATMILADLGAEVIKIESDIGDDSRHLPPKWGPESAVFLAMNRGKKSVVLDLKSEKGREAVLRLAETADVIIEGFRPGAMEKLGLSYEAVCARKPNIIFCSISAFGRGELGRGMPGYDALLQAFSGILKSTGHPGQPPARIGPSAIDLSTGMWAAMQIMAALAQRTKSDGPQRLEATLIDSSLNLMCHQLIGVLATGNVPAPQGSAAPSTAPYEVFSTGGDGEILIAAGNENLFKKLCVEMERTDLLENADYATMPDRVRNREKLHQTLEQTLLTQSLDIWIERFARAGVPAGPVQDLKQAAEHPVVAERDAIVAASRDDIPELKLLRLPLGPLGEMTTVPPKLGADTVEVLASIGMADD